MEFALQLIEVHGGRILRKSVDDVKDILKVPGEDSYHVKDYLENSLGEDVDLFIRDLSRCKRSINCWVAVVNSITALS